MYLSIGQWQIQKQEKKNAFWYKNSLKKNHDKHYCRSHISFTRTYHQPAIKKEKAERLAKVKRPVFSCYCCIWKHTKIIDVVSAIRFISYNLSLICLYHYDVDNMRVLWKNRHYYILNSQTEIVKIYINLFCM